MRTVLIFIALVFAAALTSGDVTRTGNECCWPAGLNDVRAVMFNSSVAEPASLTLFGLGLSLIAVQCRETRERNLVRVGQTTGGRSSSLQEVC